MAKQDFLLRNQVFFQGLNEEACISFDEVLNMLRNTIGFFCDVIIPQPDLQNGRF